MKPNWSQVASARTSGPLLKVRFALVVGLLVAAALAGIFALPVALSATQAARSVPDVSTVVPQARGFADRVATAWLVDGDLSAFPVAEGLTGPLRTDGLSGANGIAWDRFSRSAGDFVTGGIPYELHHFTTDVSGRRWQLSVLVLLPDSGPVLGAPVSLLPLPNADLEVAPADLTSVEVEQPIGRERVTERLQDWAAAYATDDRAELQELAGDTRSDVTYLGLGGYTATDVTLLGAFPATIEQGNVVVGRVRITMAEPAQVGQLPTDEEPTADTFTVDLDVLISEFSTQLPKVVAWGPAGSAPGLEPFINAVPAGS